jgi:hypothetical protein
MSSDRPLKAFVPGGSSVPFYLHLIYKTANGEDRLMSYESLSDGGFQLVLCWDQVDLLFTMIHLYCLILGISLVLPP